MTPKLTALAAMTIALATPAASLAQQPPPAAAAEAPRANADGAIGASDDEAADDDAMYEWRPSTPGRIQLGVLLGFGGRIDDPPLYELTEPFGFAFGGGVDLFLANRISLGLSYEHLDLGREESGVTPFGEVTVIRDLNTGWLSLRIYPVQQPSIGAYVKLAAGVAWQSAELTGSVWDPTQPGRQLQLSCEGADSAAVAFRAEAGIDVELTDGFRMPLAFHFDNYGLSSDVLDNCVSGSGSAAVLGLRSGFTFESGL